MPYYLRKHSVIVDVIPIITRGVGEYELFQPLDTPSADLTGDDSPQGTAMIRRQGFSVHFVGKHDSFIWIEDPVQLHGCTVKSIGL